MNIFLIEILKIFLSILLYIYLLSFIEGVNPEDWGLDLSYYNKKGVYYNKKGVYYNKKGVLNNT